MEETKRGCHLDPHKGRVRSSSFVMCCCYKATAQLTFTSLRAWTEAKIDANQWLPQPPSGVAQPHKDALTASQRETSKCRREATRSKNKVMMERERRRKAEEAAEEQQRKAKAAAEELQIQLDEEKARSERLEHELARLRITVPPGSVAAATTTTTSADATTASADAEGNDGQEDTTGRNSVAAHLGQGAQSLSQSQPAQAKSKPKPKPKPKPTQTNKPKPNARPLAETALTLLATELGPLKSIFEQDPASLLFLVQMLTSEFDALVRKWLSYGRTRDPTTLEEMAATVAPPHRAFLSAHVLLLLRHQAFIREARSKV